MTRLSVRSRVLSAVAALMLVVLFFVPLWRIQLQAPQYPEGLGMLIKVNTITGLAPTDLDNINGLNHYIGMKAIHPDTIPVLTYMPWVVALLSIAGLATAVFARRSLLVAWLVSFGVAGLAGLAEFYLWSYDYGHNLAADAVIKVPGMSYQPPLIGSKQLLNFTASSWPDAGGILAGVAFLVAAAALISPAVLFRAFRTRSRSAAVAMLLAAIGGTTACTSSGPVPLSIGKADCNTCRMRIVDNRFGGEVVSHTGKVMEFDSIDCLANYVVASIADSSGASIYVSDFNHPGTLIPVASARFLRGMGPGSTMGDGLVAIGADAPVTSPRARPDAAPMTWSEVRALSVRGALHRDAAGVASDD